MNTKLQMLGLCMLAFAGMTLAQTNVTNGNDGTINTVPVYTGTSTLGNSPITVSGGNVGIGTTTPGAPLTIATGTGIQVGILLENPINNWTIGTGTTDNSFRIVDNQWGERLRINNFGNVGIGTTAPGQLLEVNGTAQIDGALNVGTGGIVFPNGGGTQTVAYTGVTCGGDYAESVDVSGNRKLYQPGDVLVIDLEHPGKFLKSAEPYSTSVTGIYSTKPGTVGRRQTVPKSPDEVPMAMIGIVPTKVSAENGPVHLGDLLVTSSTIGYAMKGTDRGRLTGAVIGKALGNLESGKGIIEVVVTLQ